MLAERGAFRFSDNVSEHGKEFGRNGKRAAFVRVPERRATIIILTNDASADARGMAQRILDKILAAP